MNQEKRAWVYCRIDAPEDTHGAIKEQRKLLMDYAEQMGFSVVGCSEDTASGMELNHPGLKRAMEVAQAGSIDVLLVQNISRISRDTCRGMEYLEQFRQRGIAVYSPMEGKLDFSFQRFIGTCLDGRDICHGL